MYNVYTIYISLCNPVPIVKAGRKGRLQQRIYLKFNELLNLFRYF